MLVSGLNINYGFNNIDKSFDNNLKFKSEQNVDNEEDKILYKQLENAGVDFKNHSFQWQKENLVSFPPLTAPGNVRRAYRLALENATPDEKRAAQGMVFYMQLYKKDENINNTQNSVSDYLNLINGFKDYFDSRYSNLLSKSQYSNYNSLIDKFTDELAKY